jgi:hypothetical protein
MGECLFDAERRLFLVFYGAQYYHTLPHPCALVVDGGYGPQEDPEKILFLEELEATKDACPGPWLVIGDFNLILEESDKNNARINQRSMSNFRHTVWLH